MGLLGHIGRKGQTGLAVRGAESPSRRLPASARLRVAASPRLGVAASPCLLLALSSLLLAAIAGGAEPSSARPLAALAVPVPAEAPQGPIVRAIEIEGLQTVRREQVLRVLPVQEGKPRPNVEPGSLVRAIYATGYFQPDSIEVYEEPVGDGAVRIVIKARENPHISGITVEGAARVTVSRVLKVIPYKSGDLLKAGGQEDIRRAIFNEYRRLGYYAITVSVETVADPQDAGKVSLRIKIGESARRKLRDVIIEGNDHMPGVFLRLAMQNKGSWWPIVNYYDESGMTDDLEAIRQLYFNKGYLDCAVSTGEFRTGGEGKGAWISPVIKIVEGPRYRIGEVRTRGVSLFSERDVTVFFDPLRSKPFSGKKFRAALDKVKELYGGEGYVNAEVGVDYDKTPAPAGAAAGVVNVTLRVQEKEQIRVGRVLIDTKTYDNVELPWWQRWYSRVAPPMKEEAIGREIALKSGEVYRSFEEAKTRRRLRNLGVFKEVAIRREPTTDPQVNDVVVAVEGDNTGYLAIGGGYGEPTGVFGYIDYTEHNLLGEGNDLNAYLQLGQRESRVSLGYRDRYLGDSDYSLSVDAFHQRLRIDRHSEQQTGGYVTLGKPVREDVYARLRVKSYFVKLDENDEDDTKEDLNKDYVVATIRPSIEYDWRDNVRFPTRGGLLAAGLELGAADGPLARLDLNSEYYRSLPLDLVWFSHARFGTLATDADEVGITERYFLGGSGSLRGFETRGAGPKDDRDDDVAIGGASILTWQNELRYPLTDGLSLRYFIDAGLIGEKPLNYQSPRVSTGVGAQIDAGPASIGIDFGWAVVKKSDDETELLHLQINSRF